MTPKEIEDLIANQLKAWLMHESSWCSEWRENFDDEGFVAYTEERSKDGAEHIFRNLQTAEMCHDYLAEKGKLP